MLVLSRSGGVVNIRESSSTASRVVHQMSGTTPGGSLTGSQEVVEGHRWHEVNLVTGGTGWVRGDVIRTVARTGKQRQVILTTIHDCGDQSLGVLTVIENNRVIFIAKSLELPFKNNANRISSIPAGKYQCKWTHSPRFKRNMYLVDGVPGRSGIRIHAAMYVSHLEGCIALGNVLKDLNKDGLLDLQHSGDTCKEFEALMGGENFELIVKR
jgi:hypothetical protein